MNGAIPKSILVSLLVSVSAVAQESKAYLDTSLDFETRAGRLVEPASPRSFPRPSGWQRPLTAP
jgi:hypothetical protein